MGKMGQCCTDLVQYEMRPESLGLNHDNPSDFVRSQWPMNHKVYVLYRLAISVGFLVWLGTDAAYETQEFFEDHPYNYILYATNWSFVLLSATTLYMAVCTLYYSIRSDRQTFEKMPKALKVQWTLQNLSYNSAMVVSISYWTFIAFFDDSDVLQTGMSHLKHTLNSIFVLVDLSVSCTPIRILHLLFSVGLGSVYSLFNAIYFLNDGTIKQGRHYAYNLLDWEKPTGAIVTCSLCVVLCIFSQVVLFLEYKLRVCIFTKIYFGADADVEKPDSELQRIMGDAPVYQTLEERVEENQEHAQ